MFVWHRLGILQADSCLEYQEIRASPLDSHLQVHMVLAQDVRRQGDIGERHLVGDGEDCWCNGHMSSPESRTFWSVYKRQKISIKQEKKTSYY